MNKIDPAKGWYSAQELAGLPGMPSTSSAVIRAAKKNLWPSRTKVRGKGVEYDVRALPGTTRNHILHLALDQAPVVSTSSVAKVAKNKPPVALKPGVVAVRGSTRKMVADAQLDDKDRAYREASLVLCRAVEGAMSASQPAGRPWRCPACNLHTGDRYVP